MRKKTTDFGTGTTFLPETLTDTAATLTPSVKPSLRKCARLAPPTGSNAFWVFESQCVELCAETGTAFSLVR